MDSKPASTDMDSKSEEDMAHLSEFSVLMQFIYDTSSFSDRLVQLAGIDTTTKPTRAEDHQSTSGLAEVNTTDEKGIESVGNSFYPRTLLVE